MGRGSFFGMDGQTFFKQAWGAHNLMAFFFIFIASKNPMEGILASTFVFLAYGIAGYMLCVKEGRSAPGTMKIGILQGVNLMVCFQAATSIKYLNDNGKILSQSLLDPKSEQFLGLMGLMLFVVNAMLGRGMWVYKDQLANGG